MDKNMRFLILVIISCLIFSCGSGSNSEDSFQFKNVPDDLTILD